MLFNALVLSALSAAGLMFAWKKMPDKLRAFMRKHPLIVDVLTFMTTFVTLGGTLTALTAGSMVAIVTSIMLYIDAHSDQFSWLFKGMAWVKEQASELNKTLNTFADRMSPSSSKVPEGLQAA